MEKLGKCMLQNLAKRWKNKGKGRDPWVRTENLRIIWKKLVIAWKNWVNAWKSWVNEGCKTLKTIDKQMQTKGKQRITESTEKCSSKNVFLFQ